MFTSTFIAANFALKAPVANFTLIGSSALPGMFRDSSTDRPELLNSIEASPEILKPLMPTTSTVPEALNASVPSANLSSPTRASRSSTPVAVG